MSIASMAKRSRAWIPLLCVVSAQACSSRDDAPSEESPPRVDPSEPISGNAPEAAALRGIGQLRDRITCTAVLIVAGTNADAPAVVATSGHCVQEWTTSSANDVIVDAPATPDAHVIFNYFHDTRDAQVTARVLRILYSTMKRRDVAVLELDVTQAALAARGVTPVSIATAAPVEDAAIRVVGVPLLGSLDDSFLRSARCADAGSTSVVEFFWYWRAIHRNFCADIVPGSSGSPVMDTEGRMFALVNTTTRGSPPDGACHLGIPCELRPSGAVRVEDASYAVDVTALPACFDPDGRLEVGRPGCPLDDGRQLGIVGGPWARARPTDPVTGEARTWNVHLDEQAGFTHFRYKIGEAAATDCSSLDGYTDPEPVSTSRRSAQPLVERMLPVVEGPHLLCLLGGTGPSSTAQWQPPEHATVIVTAIDTRPPGRQPELRVIVVSADERLAEPLFEPPELSDYEYIVDPTATIDCTAIGLTWQRYRRFPFRAPRDARVCVRASDAVDNLGPPWTYEIR
jgi:hypothetical protein